jgi:hypothetical protein
MRNEDARAQLYLYRAADNPVGGGHIKADGRDVVSYLVGWHIPLRGRIDIGLVGADANLRLMLELASTCPSRG